MMTKLTRRPGPIWLLVLTTAVLATVLYHYHTPVNHLILRMTQSARLLTQSKARKSATDLGPFFSWGEKNWTRLNCDPHVPLRHVSLLTGLGNLTFYVYDSAKDDFTVTQRALKGVIFEREEIEQFLNLSKPLPLIDVGANLGLVALQAAMQGRQVVAVEPILDNALRLCRSAADFLPDPSLMRVVRNAVSSAEGNISLFSPGGHGATLFQVGLPKGRAGNVVHAIRLERLVEVVSFKTAVLKIDVESHEGHVIAGAGRLFQEMNIPMVWMEWEHVKKNKKNPGAPSILAFMKQHAMIPYNLMSGERLREDNYLKWPFTVLWRKQTS